MANTTETTPTAKRAATSDKRFILIINNEERARILTLRGRVAASSNTLTPGPKIELVPGLNLVEAALWERWKRDNGDAIVDDEEVRGAATILLQDRIPVDRHPSRRRERSGQPALVEGPRVNSRTAPLSDLDEQRAIAMAAEVLDRAACARFIKTERRAAVLEALRAQDELLNTPDQPDMLQ